MWKKNKKIFLSGAVVIILFTSSIAMPVAASNKEYFVAVGPIGAKLNQCEIIISLNTEEFNEFKNDLEDILNKNLNCSESMSQQLNLFIKYGIFPEYFTLKNLTKAIDEYKANCVYKQLNSNNGGNFEIGRTTIGPHLILYGSIFSAVVNFQPAGKIVLPRPYSDIRRVIDIFNISEGTLLYDLLYNVTVFHYLMYTTLEIMIGGSLGSYLSIGLFPGVPTYQLSKTPFIGAYLFFFGGGIYVFEGHDTEDGVDNALIDLIIGFCPFSMVTYREFSNPIP